MTIPAWNVEMDYIESCNCNFGCPCNFNGYPTNDYCHTIAAYNIRAGSYGETSLAGVKLVMAASWPGAIHQGGGTVRLHIDNSTSDAQREAIMMIFSGRAKGSGPFELFSGTFAHFESPMFADIEMNIAGRHSTFKVPGIIDVQVEPFTNPVSGEEQDIQISMPAGFIFKTALAARSRVMKLLGLGPLSFEHPGRNVLVAAVSYAGP